MMDAQTIAQVIAGGGALGAVVWLLAKLGEALIKTAEALAAAAVVLFVMLMMIKASCGHCARCSPTGGPAPGGAGGMVHWWGLDPLVVTVGVVAGALTGWRLLLALASCDAWAGRHLRAWWLRWSVCSPKLPDWLHTCGLSVKARRRARAGDGDSAGARRWGEAADLRLDALDLKRPPLGNPHRGRGRRPHVVQAIPEKQRWLAHGAATGLAGADH
jgi:hypothetical protein